MTNDRSNSVHTIDNVDSFKNTPLSNVHSDDKGSQETKEESFWSRVWNDFSNRQLLPLKILFFVKAGTVFVLYPYLNLHLKSLGLDAEEAGLSNALTILTIIGQPLAGVISDKIGNFKVFLTVITVITPIPALLMLTIPIARETISLPPNLTFSVGCVPREISQSVLTVHLESLDPHFCVTSNVNRSTSQLSQNYLLAQTQCGQICSQSNENVEFTKNSSVTLEVKYLVQDSDFSFISLLDTTKSSKLHCKLENGTENEENCLKLQTNQNLVDINFSPLKFATHSDLYENENLTWLQRDLKAAGNDLKFSHKGEGSNATSYPEYLCNGNYLGDHDCTFQCFTFMPRKLFCSNDNVVKKYNEALTFWLYNGLRVLLGLFSSTCWIMFEGAVLAIIKEKNGDYGLQRVSSQIAAIIAAPLSGFMIAYFNDFRGAFYLYAVLQVFCAFLSMKIDLDFKKPAGHIVQSLLERIRNVKVIFLFLAVLASGTAWGFLESFLFWYLQNLGGDGFLMGLTITVGGLAGLPFLVFNKPIIDKIGHVNIISLGLIFYGVRLVGYSFITDPWMCLPYESLEAITAALAITAANTYASMLATEDTVVSIQGIVGALYYSVGRSVGSLIGGYLIKLYGDVMTYRIMAIIAFSCGSMYFVFNLLYNCVRQLKLRSESKLQRSSIDIGTINGLKFDGGYVGPFTIPETETE